jgi:hypothetical protein
MTRCFSFLFWIGIGLIDTWIPTDCNDHHVIDGATLKACGPFLSFSVSSFFSWSYFFLSALGWWLAVCLDTDDDS